MYRYVEYVRGGAWQNIFRSEKYRRETARGRQIGSEEEGKKERKAMSFSLITL